MFFLVVVFPLLAVAVPLFGLGLQVYAFSEAAMPWETASDWPWWRTLDDLFFVAFGLVVFRVASDGWVPLAWRYYRD